MKLPDHGNGKCKEETLSRRGYAFQKPEGQCDKSIGSKGEDRKRGRVFPGHLVNKTDQMLILVKFILQRVDGSI